MRTVLKGTAAVIALAAVLAVTQTGIRADASAAAAQSEGREASVSGWERQKEEILEAMDVLRDHGFSPMQITEHILHEDAGGTDTPSSAGGAIRSAGESLTDQVREAGGQVLEDAQDKVEEQKQGLLEKLKQKIKDAFGSWIDGVFEDM